jgi:hypothetical protein
MAEKKRLTMKQKKKYYKALNQNVHLKIFCEKMEIIGNFAIMLQFSYGISSNYRI